MPPVLARLPEIVPDSDVDEEDAHHETSVFIEAKEGRKLRIDGAQPGLSQAEPETTPVPDEPVVSQISTTEVPAAIDSLVVSNQLVASSLTATPAPTLPPLPAADFADTAAKILAQLEGAEAAATVSSPLASDLPLEADPEPVTENFISEVASSEVASSEAATRNIRIDPGIPSPVAQGIPAEETELARKRRAARTQTAPELDVLDSPWHDWIVKLGGTFIAGLLLVAAFQAIQPDSRSERIGADPQLDAKMLNAPGIESQQLVSVPEAQEPGAFDALQNAPVFVDPDTVEDLADIREPEKTDTIEVEPGYKPVEIATTTPEPPVVSIEKPAMPTLDELAGDLMPAPAVSLPNDAILPMPSDDGNLKPEVATVIDNNLVTSETTKEGPAVVENNLLGSKVEDSLFGPPETGMPTNGQTPTNEARVALNNRPTGTVPSGPITSSAPSSYPETGYAPINRVRPQASQQPTQPIIPPQQSMMMPPQQSYAPPQGIPAQQQPPVAPAPTQRRPQFNILPQSGVAPPAAQSGVAPGEPRSPMSVQLNGTIQRYSR